MLIKTKYIDCSTKQVFKGWKLPTSAVDTSGDIYWSAVVYIRETGEIWTHGKLYGGFFSNEDSNKISLTIGGTERKLALDGHVQSYLTLTGSGSIANQAILSTGVANKWILKTLGKNAFSDEDFLPIDGTAAVAKKVEHSFSVKHNSTVGNSFDGSEDKYINLIQGDNVVISGDAQGNITIAADAGSDTVNTAGATNLIDTKLFLIGAESQTTAPKTYSNQYTYVGTDNCLYSSGTKVSVEGHTHLYAGARTAGGAALQLDLNPAGLSTANVGNYGGILQSNSNVPVAGSWFNVIKILHNDPSQYYTELAQAFSGGLWHREMVKGVLGSWIRILDSNNYAMILNPTYVRKVGDIMTGPLDITQLRTSTGVNLLSYTLNASTNIGQATGITTIVSNDSDLKHNYNGTNYTILDSRNFTNTLDGKYVTLDTKQTITNQKRIEWNGTSIIYPLVISNSSTNNTSGVGIVLMHSNDLELAKRWYLRSVATANFVNTARLEIVSGWVNKVLFSIDSNTGQVAINSTVAPLSINNSTLCTNLNADLLDGYHASSFPLRDRSEDSNEILFRRIRSDNTIETILKWTGFNIVYQNSILATVDSNVASATKLQTPRLIWGQSFDGTSNITGDLKLNVSYIYGFNNKSILYSNPSGHTVLSAAGGNLYIGNEATSAIVIRPSGTEYTTFAANGELRHTSKMIVGANVSPIITLAIGDSDTGFNWVNDGNFRVMSNGQTFIEYNSNGNIYAEKTMASRVAQGVAPISTVSTTLCPNLNTSYLGGRTLNDYTWAKLSGETISLNDIATKYPSIIAMFTNPDGSSYPENNGGWHHIYQSSYNIAGDAGNLWKSQIAVRATDAAMFVRSIAGGDDKNTGWQGWHSVLTSNRFATILDPIYIKKTGDTINGDLIFSQNGSTGIRGIKMDMGDNDYAFIRVGATAANAGYLEFATGDDATEPIYVRQYAGSNIARTLTLLDGTGNTTIPGALSVIGTAAIGGNTTIGGNINMANGGTYTTTYASGSWINAARNSAIIVNHTSYGGWVCGPAKDGRLVIASYPNSNNSFYIGYMSNSQISAGTNAWNKTTRWDGDTGYWVATGYLKEGSSDAHILLGGGGSTPVDQFMKAKSANGYYGLMSPTNNDTNWIRVTGDGLLPYSAGGSSAGHSSLGTSSWYFKDAYIQNVYGGFNGDLNGTAQFARMLAVNTQLTYGLNGLNYFNANLPAGTTPNINQAPVAGWFHILRMNHDNSTGYYTDLAFGINQNYVAYRRIVNGSNNGWYRLWDSVGFDPNTKVNKIGDTMTGTLRIKCTTNGYQEGLTIQNADGQFCTIRLGNPNDSGTSASTWSIHRTNSSNFCIDRNGSGGGNGFSINTVGNMGIGFDSASIPNYRLAVNGTGYISSNLEAGGKILCNTEAQVKGTTSTFPYFMLHIPNVTYGRLQLNSSGIFEFRDGGSQASSPRSIMSAGFIKYGSDGNWVLTGDGGHKNWTTGNIPNTIVARDGNGYIQAAYINTNIQDENSMSVGSVYVRNTSDTWIRRISWSTFADKISNSHTHGMMSSSFASWRDGVTQANWRTQVFDNNSPGGYGIKVWRWGSQTPPVFNSSVVWVAGDSTAICWAGADTHGVIGVSYNNESACIGGGNGNGLHWVRNLVHSGNISAFMMNGTAGYANGLALRDERNNNTQPYPNGADGSLAVHLKDSAVDGLPESGYHASMFIRPWTDSTGGPAFNLGFGQSGGVYVRSGFGGWGNWNKMLTSYDCPDYLVDSGSNTNKTVTTTWSSNNAARDGISYQYNRYRRWKSGMVEIWCEIVSAGNFYADGWVTVDNNSVYSPTSSKNCRFATCTCGVRDTNATGSAPTGSLSWSTNNRYSYTNTFSTDGIDSGRNNILNIYMTFW